MLLEPLFYFDAEPFMPTNSRFFERFDTKLLDSGILLCSISTSGKY